jgi:putative mRNA 3-end processing factor
VSAPLLESSPEGLRCARGSFHVDPWGAAAVAVITHVHGDHLVAGSARYVCAAPSLPFLRKRLGAEVTAEGVPYGERFRLRDVTVSFHPSGHVLGAAQIRLEAGGEVWVVSGDYKRAPDPTCAPFEPVACDVFVTESTFALPVYRWDPAAAVVADLLAWWDGNRERGLTSIVFCYTIGKAQRLLAELSRLTDRSVLVHGMLLPMIDVYRAAGVAMAPTQALIERPRGTSLAGELVLAPPSARGTPWMRRLGDLSDGLASGLMQVRGVRRQRAYDRGFVLSDHADWPALLETIAETHASRVIATHGHAEPLARYLTGLGLDTGVMRTAWESETGADDAE